MEEDIDEKIYKDIFEELKFQSTIKEENNYKYDQIMTDIKINRVIDLVVSCRKKILNQDLLSNDAVRILIGELRSRKLL